MNIRKDGLFHRVFRSKFSSDVITRHHLNRSDAATMPLPEAVIEPPPESSVSFTFNNTQNSCLCSLITLLLRNFQPTVEVFPTILFPMFPKVVAFLITCLEPPSDFINRQPKGFDNALLATLLTKIPFVYFLASMVLQQRSIDCTSFDPDD